MLLRLPSHVEKVNFGSPKGVSYKLRDTQLCEVNFEPNENIFFDYKVYANSGNKNLHHPVIESTLFHFFVDQVLITPDSNEHDLKKVKFNFNKIPHNLKIISSFAINKKEFDTTLSYASFLNSTIAGTIAPIKTIHIHGYPVHVIADGKWSFFKKDPTYYVEKLIQTQRKFWDDYAFPYYVAFLVQAPESFGYALGLHHENMLSAVMPNSPEEEKLAKACMLLSHELFHAWLGVGIKIPLPQGNLQWLFEGINDYYGIQMAIKSGLLSQKDSIALINNLIKDYYTSPFQTFPNKDLAQNFASLNPAAQLIQARSHLTFLNYLSSKKYKNSPTTPLDLALKEIYQKFKNQKVSEHEVETIFAKHFGKEQWEEIKQHIIYGKELNLNPQLFSQHALLVNKKMKIPTQGFDMASYLKLKKIKKIDIKSNAYKAGLRNNDEIAGYFLNFSDTGKPSQISIKKGKETTLISYYPNEITVAKYLGSSVALRLTGSKPIGCQPSCLVCGQVLPMSPD